MGNVLGMADQDADLDESWVAEGWESLLRRWLDEARAARIAESNAMVVGTVALVDGQPRPETRTVLCKSLSDKGLVFYTSYESAKAKQLAAIPYASATFLWTALQRQVHVRGRVEKVSREVTAEYWSTRPRDSRLGAWASEQSLPIASRAALDQALSQVQERFHGVGDIPVPPFWGGYLLRPCQVEFWQGRHGRLHNRIRVRLGEGQPVIQRLQP